jgi:hypothetical protein
MNMMKTNPTLNERKALLFQEETDFSTEDLDYIDATRIFGDSSHIPGNSMDDLGSFLMVRFCFIHTDFPFFHLLRGTSKNHLSRCRCLRQIYW